MKLIDILKYFGIDVFRVVIYVKAEGKADDDPIFEGPVCDVPWWVAQLELDEPGGDWGVLDFRCDIDKQGHPGFVITVKDD